MSEIIINKKTLAQLTQEALDVQDACNLSGVVHSFSRAVTRLREIHHEMGKPLDSAALHEHPVSVLYSSKIASLTNSDSLVAFSRAFDAATDMAGVKS